MTYVDPVTESEAEVGLKYVLRCLAGHPGYLTNLLTTQPTTPGWGLRPALFEEARAGADASGYLMDENLATAIRAHIYWGTAGQAQGELDASARGDEWLTAIPWHTYWTVVLSTTKGIPYAAHAAAVEAVLQLSWARGPDQQ